MEIRVDNLRDGPRRLVFDEPADGFPLLLELVKSGAVAFDGPLGVQLVVMQADGVIEVEGTLTCTVNLSCSRCLQPVREALALPLALTFERQTVLPDEVDERELTEAELGLIPFVGDVLDLREALAEEVVLAIPQHPLCRDDCAGLCPVCGGDLNRQRCDCTPPVFHGGFAALQGFKAKS